MPFAPTHLAAVGGRKVTPNLDQVSGLAWTYPLDPNERQPFTVDWSKETAETGAKIVAATWTIPGPATLGGVTKAAETMSGAETTLWLEVAEANRADTAYTAGTTFKLVVQVTDAIGRIYRRVVDLTVRAR